MKHLEIVITQITTHPVTGDTNRREYRYTDLEIAEAAYGNLRVADGAFRMTTIHLAEVENI